MADDQSVSLVNNAVGQKEKVDIYRDTPIRYLGRIRSKEEFIFATDSY